MFLRGGNVMPVHCDTLGSADMGRGLTTMGLQLVLVTIRRKMQEQSEARTETEV